MITVQDEDTVRELVRALWANHDKRINDTALERWTRKLLKFPVPTVARVLDVACDATRLPALSELTGQLWTKHFQQQDKDAERPTLSEAERQASELSCVKSLLWLNYNKPHAVHFMSTLAARALSCAPEEAIARAEERYPRWMIDEWMQEQRLAGN